MPFLPETPRQKKMLVVLILFLAFVGIDIFFGARYSAERDSNFRAFCWDAHTFWKLKPSYEGEAWGHSIHTDAGGFRGDDNPPLQSKHDFRIITFGDSRTYGFSVRDHEAYSYVLQEELRKRRIDAEVINAGVHGYSAVQCRARLSQMLRYKPDAAVFAPGYNDRRYLVIRPVDADRSIPWIARTRRVVDVLQWSNTVFALFYEVGRHKLKAIQENPPGLDEVQVRVSEETFRDELMRMADLCREHGIQPVFLRIYQDPAAFALVEAADRLNRSGEHRQAVEMIEESDGAIPDRSYAMSRWALGRAYRRLGDEAKARVAFVSHEPLGSLFGESVLRSEEVYFSIFQEIANAKNIPLADAKEAMGIRIDDPREADNEFQSFFVDECHYSADGHRRIGEALATLFTDLFNKQ